MSMPGGPMTGVRNGNSTVRPSGNVTVTNSSFFAGSVSVGATTAAAAGGAASSSANFMMLPREFDHFVASCSARWCGKEDCVVVLMC
jgi:hypothetical protein